MSRYDDEQLGEIMREGLHAHADRVDGRLGPLPPRSASRRGRWLAVAAAAVLATGGTLTWRALRSDDGVAPIATAPQEPPPDWRAESYGGVQVVVPPSWIVAYGPMSHEYQDYLEDASWCADGSTQAYVGRPVSGSDICTGFDAENQDQPTVDSVWFGAPVPAGTRSLGAFTQVTREVGDSTVTVTTRDPALGEQILATASAVDVDANGCATHITGPPAATAATGAAILPVCVYRVYSDLSATLIWSSQVSDPGAVAAYHDAVAVARGGDELAACKRSPDGEWVTVGSDVVDFACGKILSADGDAHLTRDSVQFWASDGTRAYIGGPASGDWSGLFLGMLG